MTDNTTETAVSGIVDFVAPAKPNKYTTDVQSLIDAGEGKAYRLVVPTTETKGEGKDAKTRNVAQLERLEFQRAANDLDRTARIVPEATVVDDKANTTTFVFTLKPKYNKGKLGPRNKAEDSATAAVEDSTPAA